ncbi:MAG: hypothetical protein MZV64_00120 [Ignavibacteriales bacterium]|nr:hypothetical protein [Ignavibacteriales bacterium]
MVIGETAEVGEEVTLVSRRSRWAAPACEQGQAPPHRWAIRSSVGAGAKILGPIDHRACDSRIGANAVVVRSTPPDLVVAGVPGRSWCASTSRTWSTVPTSTSAACPTPSARCWRRSSPMSIRSSSAPATHSWLRPACPRSRSLEKLGDFSI